MSRAGFEPTTPATKQPQNINSLKMTKINIELNEWNSSKCYLKTEPVACKTARTEELKMLGTTEDDETVLILVTGAA
jgi:hypothetical protein